MSDPALLREGLRDRYAFERELGRGGMATVWLAADHPERSEGDHTEHGPLHFVQGDIRVTPL